MSVEYYRRVKRNRSKAYEIGSRFEYKGMAFLRKLGWHCMRRFGSIGVFFCPKCMRELKRPPKGAKAYCPVCKVEGVKASLDVTAYKDGEYLMISFKYRSDRASVYMDDEVWQNLVLYASKFKAIPMFCGITLDRKMYFIDLRTLMNFDAFATLAWDAFTRIKEVTWDFVACFVDTDGSVNKFQGQDSKAWEIVFYNTNRKSLEFLKRFLKIKRKIAPREPRGISRKMSYSLTIRRKVDVLRIALELKDRCIIKGEKLEQAIKDTQSRFGNKDAFYRHKKGEEPEKSDINKVIEEAWSVIDLANEFLGQDVDDKCKACKMRARWAEVKIKMLNILNRVLWRAGKTESTDDITKLFEPHELEEEEEKNAKKS